MAITTHACSRTIEDWRFTQVVLVTEPIPVRLVASVAALFPQRLLEGMHKVPMPAQEVTGTVDGSGLVDVLSNEVVVSGSSSRNQFRVRLGGRSVHTLNSAAIRFALLCGHEVPASVKHW